MLIQKIYLATLLFCVGSTHLLATDITPQQAASIAAKYITLAPTKQTKSKAKRHTAPNAPYYVFNDAKGKGFVIVSGEDQLPEIVAYSRTGYFDSTHCAEGATAYLANYTQYVKQVKRGNVVAEKPFHRINYFPKEIVPPLVHTLWNQNYPYNKFCPDNMPTGCVATTMAQLMYVHQWPKQGAGTKRISKQNSDNEFIDFSTHTYAWDKMLLDYDKAPKDDAANDAVATLMRDAGIAVNMNYAHNGSTAFTRTAATALHENFGYDTRYIQRVDYTPEEYFSIIKSELDNGFPMMIVGYGKSWENVGHAWVLDGYDENGFCHMNWGWAGSGDGYFDLRFLSPKYRGIGGGGDQHEGYNQGCELVLVHPRNPNQTTAAFPAIIRQLSFSSGGGMQIDKEKVAINQPITVTLHDVGNRTSETLTGFWAVGIYKADGTLAKVIESPTFPVGGQELVSGATYTVAQQYEVRFEGLTPDTYTLRPIVSLKSTTDESRAPWTPLTNNIYAQISVSDTEAKIVAQSGIKARLALLSQPQVTAIGRTGGYGAISLMLKNEQSLRLEGNLLLRLTKVTEDKQPLPNAATKETTLVKNQTLHAFEMYSDNLKYSTEGLEAGWYRAEVVFQHHYMQPTMQVVESDGPFYLEIANISHQIVASNLKITDDSFYRPLQQRSTFNLATDHTLHVGVECKNNDVTPYDGKVVYQLRDMQTDSILTIGDTAINIGAEAIQDPIKALIPFTPTAIGVQAGHTYCFEVVIDGKDIWEAGKERFYLDFIDQQVTNIASTTETQTPLLITQEAGGLNITIDKALPTIVVYDLHGKKIAQKQPTTPTTYIQLSKGWYILKVGNKTVKYHKD